MPGQSDNYYNIRKNTQEENKKYKQYSCVPNGFKPSISQLIKKGYNPLLLKAALGMIGRETSYGNSLRYKILSPLKNIGAYLGFDTSAGLAQMKNSTKESLNIKEDINTVTGALIAIYKFLDRSYKKAIQEGYSTSQPSTTPKTSTGNAALDISIASYNIGFGRIVKYCKTDDPNIKRPCSKAGKIVEQSVVGAPNMGVTGQKSNPNDNVKKTKFKVSNELVKNYLPNIPINKLTTYGYVDEVANRIKGFNCF